MNRRNIIGLGFICCVLSWIALPALCWILYIDADNGVKRKSEGVFEAVRMVYEKGRNPDEFIAFKQLPLIAVDLRERYFSLFFLLWVLYGVGIGLIGLTLIRDKGEKKMGRPSG